MTEQVFSSSGNLSPVSELRDSSPSNETMQALARTVGYVFIGTLTLAAGFVLILFPPAGILGVVAGLGVYYGGIGAVTFGPGIFAGSAKTSAAMNRVRDQALGNGPVNQSSPLNPSQNGSLNQISQPSSSQSSDSSQSQSLPSFPPQDQSPNPSPRLSQSLSANPNSDSSSSSSVNSSSVASDVSPAPKPSLPRKYEEARKLVEAADEETFRKKISINPPVSSEPSVSKPKMKSEVRALVKRSSKPKKRSLHLFKDSEGGVKTPIEVKGTQSESASVSSPSEGLGAREKFEKGLFDADPEKDPEFQARIAEFEKIKSIMKGLELSSGSELVDSELISHTNKKIQPSEKSASEDGAIILPNQDPSSKKDVISYSKFEQILDGGNKEEDFDVTDIEGLKRALFYLDVDAMPKDIQVYLLNKKRYKNPVVKASDVRAFVNRWLANYHRDAKPGEDRNKLERYGVYLKPEYREHYKRYLERESEQRVEAARSRYLDPSTKGRDTPSRPFLRRKTGSAGGANTGKKEVNKGR